MMEVMKYQKEEPGKIDGVIVRMTRVIADDRGRLGEIVRQEHVPKFGQVYFTTTYPGVVKAWHMHKVQKDNVCCIKGRIKLVLFDAREDSKTRDELAEIYLGEHAPLVVTIPPGVIHGWQCVSPEEAYIVNVVTEPYNYEDPDEWRVNSDDIPYDWSRKIR